MIIYYSAVVGVSPLKNSIRRLIINYIESLTSRTDDEIPIMINIFRAGILNKQFQSTIDFTEKNAF